jgi:hypothetical protein
MLYKRGSSGKLSIISEEREPKESFGKKAKLSPNGSPTTKEESK